jgi:hypothetical protein
MLRELNFKPVYLFQMSETAASYSWEFLEQQSAKPHCSASTVHVSLIFNSENLGLFFP